MKSSAKLFIVSVFVSLLNFTPSALASHFETKNNGLSEKRRADPEEEQDKFTKKRNPQMPPQASWTVCKNCSHKYDDIHYEQLLSCGDTFCAPCVEKFSKKSSTRSWGANQIICPKCGKMAAAPEKNVKSYDLRKANRDNQNSPFMQISAQKDPDWQGSRATFLSAEGFKTRAQELRNEDQIVEALVTSTWAIKLHNILAKRPGDDANQKEKLGGWIYAQVGFWLEDLEQPIAIKFFEKALEFFEAYLIRAKAESKNKELPLIRRDYMIIKLHYLGLKQKFKLIASHEAESEIKEIEEFFNSELNGTYPSKAQLMLVKSLVHEESGDCISALICTEQSIKLSPGLDIPTVNLIRLLADKAEKGAAISADELLQNYNALEWKKTFERIKKRTDNRGDVPAMAPGLFNLGRMARGLGLPKVAMDFMRRCVDVMITLKAQFEEAQQKDEFKGLLIAFNDPLAEFRYELPKWVAQAETAIAELAVELAVTQEIPQAAPPELSVFQDMPKVLLEHDHAQDNILKIESIFEGI